MSLAVPARWCNETRKRDRQRHVLLVNQCRVVLSAGGDVDSVAAVAAD